MPATFLMAYEFFLNQHSTFELTATKNSVFYFISREVFENESERDIEFKQYYHLMQYDLLIRKKLKRIFYGCYFCHEEHQFQQCETMFPQFTNIELEEYESEKQERNRRLV